MNLKVATRRSKRYYLARAGALAAQNAKPPFDLVKPTSVGWRKMKMVVGMALEPAVFGLVGIELSSVT
jgi:hypothetical protein